MLEVGRRLRIARKLRRSALSEVGLPTSTLNALESGRRCARLETVLAYADALGVSMGDLCAGLPDVRDAELREAWRRAGG
jgi:transcriptional regulator with XRE-family HTH domain